MEIADQEVLSLWTTKRSINDIIEQDERADNTSATKPPVNSDGEFSGDMFNKEYSDGACSDDSGFDLDDLESDESHVEETALVVDGKDLRDFPAKYFIPGIRKHEFPVVGIYVDPRIVCGFRYRVRPIQDEESQKKERLLFNGCALELQSIGRGYSRRLTFQPDEGTMNDNPNYFWADSRPNGFAFEISVISPGDMFMIQDANHIIIGTLQVVSIQGSQEEITHQVLDDGEVEKTIRVRTFCKVEYFQDNNVGHALVPMSGVSIVSRARGSRSATVFRVTNVSLGTRRGYTLLPGVDNKYRTVTVSGADIGDAPTTYTITGLEPYEMPVIGTFVDPRIVPGFEYRVCPAGSTRRHLFNGEALRLVSVGMGYAKRLTFAPSPNQLNNNSNYFWSDSYPDGLGFEPRALHVGMKFNIYAGEQRLGYAKVYRADASQVEERQELIDSSVVKYIHVDVVCQVVLEQPGDGDKYIKIEDIHRMRVAGTAILVKPPRATAAKLLRVENIGLDSLLNLLFICQESRLVFVPMED
ncbi:hypothetical protein WDU94_014625 [Cyamophila willieti]